MLFPIRDENPSRERPIVNYILIGINILVFLYEISLGSNTRTVFFHRFGIVPYEYTHRADIFVPSAIPINLITAMFIHGGFWHIFGNMWFLYIFGDNVEDAMGHVRYLIFYLLSGIIASATHIIFNPGSRVPMIGASGAISGVLGAYFVLYPSARIVSIVFLGFFITSVILPAYLYLGIWIIMQTIFAFSSIGVDAASGVAWFAHVGGFVGGILLLPLFARRRRTPPRVYWW